jgi:hypothetical protein
MSGWWRIAQEGATVRGGRTNSYAPQFNAVKHASGEARDTSLGSQLVKRRAPVRAASGEAQCQKLVKRASPKPVKNQNHTVDLHRPVARAARSRGRQADILDCANDDFETFWRVYPHRGEHPDPKKPARLRFEAAIRRGADPADIVRGAEIYHATIEGAGTDPRYIAQAVTWLNQERWNDYRDTAEPPRLRVGMN